MFFAEIINVGKGYTAKIQTKSETRNFGSVNYNGLVKLVERCTGIRLVQHKSLRWTQKDGLKYAYIDATQPLNNGLGCCVTLAEIEAGHKPNFQ